MLWLETDAANVISAFKKNISSPSLINIRFTILSRSIKEMKGNIFVGISLEMINLTY